MLRKAEIPMNSGSPPFLFPYCSAIFPQNGKNRIYESNSPPPLIHEMMTHFGGKHHHARTHLVRLNGSLLW